MSDEIFPADDRVVEFKRAIEAVVLVAHDPVAPDILAQLIEQPVGLVERWCNELAAEYAESNRGFELARVAGGYRYQTHRDLTPYVERFVLHDQKARLSGAALETLAIIAYKQPISRAQVASIRGVDPDGVIRTLQARGYICESGRDDGPGQAILFGTTDVFLEKLGLDSLDHLPPIAEFIPGADVVETLEQGLRVDPLADSVPNPPPATEADDATAAAPDGDDHAVPDLGVGSIETDNDIQAHPDAESTPADDFAADGLENDALDDDGYWDEPATEQHPNAQSAGDGPAGDDPAGDDPAGDDPAGDHSGADDPTPDAPVDDPVIVDRAIDDSINADRPIDEWATVDRTITGSTDVESADVASSTDAATGDSWLSDDAWLSDDWDSDLETIQTDSDAEPRFDEESDETGSQDTAPDEPGQSWSAADEIDRDGG